MTNSEECPECGKPLDDVDDDHDHDDDRPECAYGSCSDPAVEVYAISAPNGSLSMAACDEHAPADEEPDRVLVDERRPDDESNDDGDEVLDRGEDSVAVDVVEHA